MNTPMDRKIHWDNVYKNMPLDEVSWYQPVPYILKEYLDMLQLPKDASIIDIGGGDSLVVDFLLDNGYTNVTVLDISENAIERAKIRLKEKADQVVWINKDILEFTPDKKYDLWYDRAAFHFIKNPNDIANYATTCGESVNVGGYLIIGTFATDGPVMCSGIEVAQYDEDLLNEVFDPFFEKESCSQVIHQTPSGNEQNFTFCLFKRQS